MTTSLIEMLELPNFVHMTKSTIWFEWRDKILLVTSWTESWRYNFYFKIPLFWEDLEEPFLVTSSKLLPCLLKKSLKTQKKLKELEIMYQNPIYICILWYSKIC